MSDPRSLQDVVVAAIASAERTDAVAEICLAVVARLPVDGGAFTAMTSDAVQERLCASDDRIAGIVDLEFTLGEGPGWQAHSTGAPVLIPNLASVSSARWPIFAAALADLAVGGLFVFPMQVGAIGLGVCEFYRDEPGPLSVDELALALMSVDLVTRGLLYLRGGKIFNHVDGAWLGETPDRVVHQATGMLIGQLGLPVEEAFARLRGYAFAKGRRIGDVATDIVERRLRLDLEPD